MSSSVTGRLCPYPFSRMESPGKPFIPCCRSWLTEEFLALEAGEDPWNGPAAQALRRSMYEGDFRFCRQDRCATQLWTSDELAARESRAGELPISDANLRALSSGSAVLPDGPAALTVMGDPRCNLACGSCRAGLITRESPEIRADAERTDRLLKTHARSLRILKLAGDGEVFFSPFLRKLLSSLTKENFPRLEKVDVLTNGLLLDQQTLADLRPGSDLIRSVSVSMDAGDEVTYAKIRGGNWGRLQNNLRWLAAERGRGRFDFLGLTYVLQSENFRSLPAFLELASELGADEVYVSQLYPWERMGVDFSERAVHRPGHPQHAAFRDMWQTMCSRDWRFRWRSNIDLTSEPGGGVS